MKKEKNFGVLLLLTIATLLAVIVLNSSLTSANISTCSSSAPPLLTATPVNGTTSTSFLISLDSSAFQQCVCAQQSGSLSWFDATISPGDGTPSTSFSSPQSVYISHQYTAGGTYYPSATLTISCGAGYAEAAPVNAKVTVYPLANTAKVQKCIIVSINAPPAPTDSINATIPSGLVTTVVDGKTASYSSTFTWTGSPTSLTLDHYDASGKSVKNMTTSGVSSPQKISSSFTFSGTGTHKVCAEGSAGTASIPPKTRCVSVTVTSPPANKITVLSPNGGENWTVGTNHQITWNSTSTNGTIANVKIELSRNGGSTWSILTSSTPNDGSYTWNVTGPATTAAEILIMDASYSAVYDTSNAPFTIYQIPAKCDLSSASGSWSQSQVVTGTNVGLTISGAKNCDGDTVLFDVYNSNGVHQSTVPSSAQISGGTATSTWTAVYNNSGASGANLYFFEGYVSAASTTIISADPKLNVTSNIGGGFDCSNITLCSDYKNSASCNNDTCSVAGNMGGTGCSWDSSTSTCNTIKSPSKCGDGVIEAGEQCDTNGGTPIFGNLGSLCTGVPGAGFTGGTLGCTSNCLLDESGCIGGITGGFCGDGKVQSGGNGNGLKEQCDGSIGSAGCTNFDNNTGGTLSCNNNVSIHPCQWNTTLCTGGTSNITHIGNCEYTEVPLPGQNCSNPSGSIKIQWTGKWVWDPSNPNQLGTPLTCPSGQKVVECPSQAALPFFGTYNLVAALVIIALIYWILLREKRVRKIGK